MATAGSIVIDLVMRTGLFETDTKRAEKRLKELQKTAKAAGVALGTVFVAAGTALAVLTKQAIDNADAMRDMSIRLGTSTETLSAFGYAASQTGTDIDTLGKGLKVLAKNAADSLNPTSEQAKVFDALGIKVTDATGKIKDLSQLVPEIADKFKQLEDGTTKAALAQALFGKASLDLTELLNQGSQGLQDFTDRARELGIVIDSGTASAANDFNDGLGDLRVMVGALGLQVAKELLPRLNDLVGSLSDVVKEGGAAEKIASTLGTAFDFAADSARVVSATFKGVAYDLTAITLAAIATGKVLSRDYFGAAAFLKQAADFRKMAAAESDKIGRVFGPDFGNVTDGRERWRNVTSGSSSSGDADLARRVGIALSNPTIPSGGSKAKQLSEEDREAQRLLETYQRLSASYDEQIALFGKTGEAAQVRYDIEFGELAKLAPAQQADLLAKAERLDQMNEELELQRKLDEADRRRLDNFNDVMKGIKDQSELIALSSDEQEIWNNLKWAGVSAQSALGQAIVASTRELQNQRDAMDDQVEAMDAVRNATSGFFEDLMNGSKSLADAFNDALGSILESINRIVAENLAESLFGQSGSGGGGTWGDALGSIFGAFFGGSRAGGGDTIANRGYWVGEQGPELFVPRTAGTILPTDQSHAVTGGGRGMQQVNNFLFGAPTSLKTQTQMASRAGFEIRRAQRLGSS